MSHRATSWAFQQRGLKPGAFRVLVQLADRHNPDLGCFPSIATLAADCEMSATATKDSLARLEKMGLICRTPRIDPRTKRQMSTRYLFPFDDGFEDQVAARAAEAEMAALGVGAEQDDPCEADAEPAGDHQQEAPVSSEPWPESGHGSVAGKSPEPWPDSGKSRGRNPATNLVREPVREKEDCSSADADTHDQAFEKFWLSHPRPRNRDRTRALFEDAVNGGTDPDLIIGASRRYAAEQAGNAAMYVCRSDNWLDNRRWTDFAQGEAAPSGDVSEVEKIARFWAGKLAAGRYIPPSAITDRVAAEIVRLGLAGRSDLMRCGVRM